MQNKTSDGKHSFQVYLLLFTGKYWEKSRPESQVSDEKHNSAKAQKI